MRAQDRYKIILTNKNCEIQRDLKRFLEQELELAYITNGNVKWLKPFENQFGSFLKG